MSKFCCCHSVLQAQILPKAPQRQLSEMLLHQYRAGLAMQRVRSHVLPISQQLTLNQCQYIKTCQEWAIHCLSHLQLCIRDGMPADPNACCLPRVATCHLQTGFIHLHFNTGSPAACMLC